MGMESNSGTTWLPNDGTNCSHFWLMMKGKLQKIHFYSFQSIAIEFEYFSLATNKRLRLFVQIITQQLSTTFDSCQPTQNSVKSKRVT